MYKREREWRKQINNYYLFTPCTGIIIILAATDHWGPRKLLSSCPFFRRHRTIFQPVIICKNLSISTSYICNLHSNFLFFCLDTTVQKWYVNTGLSNWHLVRIRTHCNTWELRLSTFQFLCYNFTEMLNSCRSISLCPFLF